VDGAISSEDISGCTSVVDNRCVGYRTSGRQTVLSMMSRDKNSNKNRSDARRSFLSLSDHFRQHNAASLGVRSPHCVIVTSLVVTGQLLCSRR